MAVLSWNNDGINWYRSIKFTLLLWLATTSIWLIVLFFRTISSNHVHAGGVIWVLVLLAVYLFGLYFTWFEKFICIAIHVVINVVMFFIGCIAFVSITGLLV